MATVTDDIAEFIFVLWVGVCCARIECNKTCLGCNLAHCCFGGAFGLLSNHAACELDPLVVAARPLRRSHDVYPSLVRHRAADIRIAHQHQAAGA